MGDRILSIRNGDGNPMAVIFLGRFNATLMLESLRGKRMMFVGDSLNRGQYVSMVCLLHRLIPEDKKSMETYNNDALTVFRVKDYNATIEFYWAPFLLESNSDNAVVHRISDRIVRKGSMNKHGRHWKGVDILVFNTYLWWVTGQDMKILKGSFKDVEKEIMQISTEDAYRMAMKSLLRWVTRNLDREKTRVFFTSMSPTHSKGNWGGEAGENCYNQTTPIVDPNYWGSDSRKSIMKVIGEEFSKSEFPITFLNITQLSSYRKDAHTSIYKKQWNPLTTEQLANPASYADCIHWCLPGLQDTWNELLFAKLFHPDLI
ncbi:hypothetical protein ES332_A10G289800v1 [Gossypium tomentosum]|uniref:Trichome birefringence-like C-terminal domain-containing protein n=1 Tax=Gossypium tomentosum TaxID=34277 RepID=A0A5D2NW31_GOSTO|nr:hypothetical protein ES332_A10G289800v1 [Gossypium tomentosum]